jgi:hypothetical protein
MNFTYEIDGFNKQENVLRVLYTPEDTTKDPVLWSVYLTPEMTEQEIKQAIVNSVPVNIWNRVAPVGVESLIGTKGEASTLDIIRPEPVPGVFNYPDGTTSVIVS